MKRAMSERNLRDALKNASAMLGELRAQQLSPKNYYALFTHATFELEFVREFFANKETHGRSAMELYELVQHAGNVLPRLYLLVCVGSVYVVYELADFRFIFFSNVFVRRVVYISNV